MATKSGALTKSQKNKLKKNVKKLHTAYIVIAVIFLLIGTAAGIYFAMTSTEGDRFELNGSKNVSYLVGEEATYKDEGITCISMGEDISNNVEITTNLTLSVDGSYLIDTTDVGEYYIKYTMKDGRYAGLCRVRLITVGEACDD